MKRTWMLIVALAILLSACASKPAASGSLLKVTDGKSEKTYTFEDLKALGADQASFREVAYVGVKLSTLLKDAGFDPAGLSAVKAVAVDGFSANYEPALFNQEDTLVSYARADGPLAQDEAPFRMVLPGQEGKLNPRQLVEIRAVP